METGCPVDSWQVDSTNRESAPANTYVAGTHWPSGIVNPLTELNGG